jgi:hypothetical protein
MIKWTEDFDDEGNSVWEGDSPYHDDGVPFAWRIRQRLVNNLVEWYDDSTAELRDPFERNWWTTLKAAKEYFEVAHTSILADIAKESDACEKVPA